MSHHEELLSRTIKWVSVYNGLKRLYPPVSLRMTNELLHFFVVNARFVPFLSVGYLIDLAKLSQAHPTDWQDRATAKFRIHRREIAQLPAIPILLAHSEQIKLHIFEGVFETNARCLEDSTIDLVVTSPPYAMQRDQTYGGVDADAYADWTVKWMKEVRRVLKPDGSVIINIRPHVKDGEISDFMLRTRLALRADGWKECDEWIWIKPDGPPLGHTKRPRRSWESIHWFAMSNDPYCEPTASGTPSDRLGITSKRGLGVYLGDNSVEYKSGTARSRDILVAPVSDNDRSEWNTHPAQYPVTMVEQIIQMLCPPDGVVLDPFIGSGTTAIAALKHGRRYFGFEKEGAYVDIAKRRITEFKKE